MVPDNLVAISVILIGGVIYFIPSFIAASAKKRNAGAIFALNLLAGWTVIGWFIALTWALTHDQEPQQPIVAPVVEAPQLKKCPDCPEIVLAEARKCRFCGHEFNQQVVELGGGNSR